MVIKTAPNIGSRLKRVVFYAVPILMNVWVPLPLMGQPLSNAFSLFFVTCIWGLTPAPHTFPPHIFYILFLYSYCWKYQTSIPIHSQICFLLCPNISILHVPATHLYISNIYILFIMLLNQIPPSFYSTWLGERLAMKTCSRSLSPTTLAPCRSNNLPCLWWLVYK